MPHRSGCRALGPFVPCGCPMPSELCRVPVTEDLRRERAFVSTGCPVRAARYAWAQLSGRRVAWRYSTEGICQSFSVKNRRQVLKAGLLPSSRTTKILVHLMEPSQELEQLPLRRRVEIESVVHQRAPCSRLEGAKPACKASRKRRPASRPRAVLPVPTSDGSSTARRAVSKGARLIRPLPTLVLPPQATVPLGRSRRDASAAATAVMVLRNSRRFLRSTEPSRSGIVPAVRRSAVRCLRGTPAETDTSPRALSILGAPSGNPPRCETEHPGREIHRRPVRGRAAAREARTGPAGLRLGGRPCRSPPASRATAKLWPVTWLTSPHDPPTSESAVLRPRAGQTGVRLR